MVNNYSHDIATAFLAVSSATLWLLSRGYPGLSDPEGEEFFARIYLVVARLAKYSLAWVLIAGVPRIIFYRQYEWSDSAGDFQVVAIVIKHIVMFSIVGVGAVYWARLDRKVKYLRVRSNVQEGR